MSRKPYAHSVHHTHTPHSHRDALPAQRLRYSARAARHSHGVKPASVQQACASALTIFYVARGFAILLTAVAVGLSAASDDVEHSAASHPTSPHATAR
jgi:hypothetical protein